jgi:hypothetical protein
LAFVAKLRFSFSLVSFLSCCLEELTEY